VVDPTARSDQAVETPSQNGNAAKTLDQNGDTAKTANQDGHTAEAMSQNGQTAEAEAERGQAVAFAAEALLREHPDALVAGLSSNGLIVPIPGAVALWGQVAIEGRAVIDSVVAADRNTVVELWVRSHKEGSVSGKVRLLDKPSRWMTLHFMDIRDAHGILLCVILPSDEPGDEDDDSDAAELPPTAPRFSTLMEDELGKVLDCDPAFTQMFGYTPEDVIGQSVLDQMHPEDQGRVVEGWLTMVSTHRDQHTRLRRKRKDGSWMWVDTTLHNYLNDPTRNHVLVEIIDVSAEMAAQEALQEREELLRRLTDAMPVGLLQLDTERNVVYNNAHLLDILHDSRKAFSAEVDPAAPSGTDAAEEHAPSMRALLSTLTDEGLAAFETALGQVFDEGIDQDIEVDMVLQSGVWRRALMSIRTLMRQGGEVSGAITCVLDITDSARARQELERRATYDALTSCYNRSSILATLQAELEREAPSMTGIVYVDLDKFKAVNDTLGHAAGDELLTLVAERLKVAGRADDVVGRLGGDEFLVLLRDIPSPEVAMRVAHQICTLLGGKFELSSETVELRASVGVTTRDTEKITAEELVKHADAAMYQSKDQGLGLPVLAAGPQAPQPNH
jgi:diguanylate cyclase (GGDEF)-like protein/PAS domain S-box-containing protein